jgi:hypothetical protein
MSCDSKDWMTEISKMVRLVRKGPYCEVVVAEPVQSGTGRTPPHSAHPPIMPNWILRFPCRLDPLAAPIAPPASKPITPVHSF